MWGRTCRVCEWSTCLIGRVWSGPAWPVLGALKATSSSSSTHIRRPTWTGCLPCLVNVGFIFFGSLVDFTYTWCDWVFTVVFVYWVLLVWALLRQSYHYFVCWTKMLTFFYRSHSSRLQDGGVPFHRRHRLRDFRLQVNYLLIDI